MNDILATTESLFTVSAPAAPLARALKAALSHASADHARPQLAGVLIESGYRLRVVATDGHRLLRYDVIGAAGTGSGHALLPAETAKRFLAAIQDALKAAAKALRDELIAEITISRTISRTTAPTSVGAWTATLTSAGVTVTLPTTDEQFPPYARVIPAWALQAEGFTGADCERAGVARLDSRYLAEALAVTARVPGGASAVADIVVRGALDPICLSRTGDAESVLIVIMTRRR
jgi:hypothetical protein